MEESKIYKIALAALAATSVLFAGTAIAQQNIDFSKVEVKTTDRGNNTYMLTTARERIGKLFNEGKTEAEVLAAKPLADLDAKWAADEKAARDYTRMVYTTRSSGRNGQEFVGLPRQTPDVLHSSDNVRIVSEAHLRRAVAA